MSVEAIDNDGLMNIGMMDDSFLREVPLNGTDARRRIEDKMEELRLKREIKEFDFDYDI